MNDKILSNNELKFLKFINGKNINIEFSTRWKFQYEINPDKEVEKLLKLKYISYNNCYTLTDKGIKTLEKNKKLFMTDKEKAGKDFEELTDKEYNELQAFRKLKEYKRLKQNELSFEKGYNKNDILWNIYNQQKDIYIRKKDYIMASVVYNRMYETLKREKKYKKALDFLICCLYLRVYDNYLYERHLLKFMKDLNSILKKNNIDVTNFQYKYKFIVEDIKTIIKEYLLFLYNDDKINIFQQKINEFLST